jgi:hypothetical protein
MEKDPGNTRNILQFREVGINIVLSRIYLICKNTLSTNNLKAHTLRHFSMANSVRYFFTAIHSQYLAMLWWFMLVPPVTKKKIEMALPHGLNSAHSKTRSLQSSISL